MQFKNDRSSTLGGKNGPECLKTLNLTKVGPLALKIHFLINSELVFNINILKSQKLEHF